MEDLEEELAAAGREVAALKSQLAQRDQRVRELDDGNNGMIDVLCIALFLCPPGWSPQ